MFEVPITTTNNLNHNKDLRPMVLGNSLSACLCPLDSPRLFLSIYRFLHFGLISYLLCQNQHVALSYQKQNVALFLWNQVLNHSSWYSPWLSIAHYVNVKLYDNIWLMTSYFSSFTFGHKIQHDKSNSTCTCEKLINNAQEYTLIYE